MNTLTFEELRNDTSLKFTDISTEASRRYRYPREEYIVIEAPVALNVSKAGGHRILDGKGVSHYVPRGWIGLSWVAKDGEPHFVK